MQGVQECIDLPDTWPGDIRVWHQGGKGISCNYSLHWKIRFEHRLPFNLLHQSTEILCAKGWETVATISPHKKIKSNSTQRKMQKAEKARNCWFWGAGSSFTVSVSWPQVPLQGSERSMLQPITLRYSELPPTILTENPSPLQAFGEQLREFTSRRRTSFKPEEGRFGSDVRKKCLPRE